MLEGNTAEMSLAQGMLAIAVHTALEFYCGMGPSAHTCISDGPDLDYLQQEAKERSLAMPATTYKLLAISLSLDSLVIY